ncbi:hypoxanthine phosphoribosyltransferase [Sporanaerobium hydrogeniformans]|uniref:Hypoxanthine phosphoribosyltransferase n=1 Tax=Sporanaerobium hydrogeniformans TaxID=3072179 RepID=A0AC61DGD8_9FIRM|nr:hypoxanthine phosphoribosyltransferase [Sporanaerobium hydrogeniformans]PHV71677.1 hypoxanthine phosphoribosyltransferase [Sporanaerobium hydrogeniformans]
MKRDIEKILFSEEQLEARLNELGQQITKDYQGKELLVIGILKGSNIFTSDLVRKINLPLNMDFMVVSSYGNAASSSGVVRILKDLEQSAEGKHLLIVEDIVDSGLTLNYLKDVLQSRKPASVKICTLLDKPAGRKQSIQIDYCGFEVPDEFIVGYGIDYAEKYRNLPFVGVLKREVYSH